MFIKSYDISENYLLSVNKEYSYDIALIKVTSTWVIITKISVIQLKSNNVLIHM